MNFHCKCLLIIFSFTFINTLAHAFQNYQLVGEGEMRWLAFNLYNAKLLTPDGYYQKNKWPLALKLTYHKNIKKIDLIQATTDEWERMGVKYSPEWVSKLYTSWPSVNKGDTLLVHIDEQGNSKFYYNNIYVGTINNEVFSKVFLAIWLSDKSRNQVLRRKLIGANKGT